jgi:hypothetical protein
MSIGTKSNVSTSVGERDALVRLLDVGVLGVAGLVASAKLDVGRVHRQAVRKEGLDLVLSADVRTLAEGVVETSSTEGLSL